MYGENIKKSLVTEVAEILKNLSGGERIILQNIFLGSVYASFFLFEPLKNGQNKSIEEFVSVLVSTQTKENILFDNPGVFNVTQMFSDDVRVNFEIDKVFLFPFIEIPFNRYSKEFVDPSVKTVIEKFNTVFHRYFCVMEISGYIIVFTDIVEDFFDRSTNALLAKGYRKIELHNIIPKVINSLSEKFETGDAQISQLGVSFPLSMLGPHASILDKIKDKAKISRDENFKKVVRYGLLDSVQINSKFKIAFNSANEKDKYMLPGYLWSEGSVNVSLLENLHAFLEEISAIDTDNDNGGFAGLPIYVIAGKRSYRNKIDYPKFSLSGGQESFQVYLNFDETNSDYLGDSTIAGKFQITGIYPQYLKLWHSKEKKVDLYCHLHEKDDGSEWFLGEESIKELFSLTENIYCDEFLNQIRKEMSGRYRYISESIAPAAGHGHPNLMTSDLFMTARLESTQTDYLINITNPKTGQGNGSENLGKKISVELYRLASFNFGINQITQSIEKYQSNLIRLPRIGLMEIMGYTPNDGGQRILLNGKMFTRFVHLPDEEGKKDKSKSRERFKKPDEYGSIPYVAHSLPLEDIISLSFMQLLEGKKYYDRVFFGGKGPGTESRELADIITVKRIRNGYGDTERVEIGLFHMKSDPFLQKGVSSIDASFSLYTTVVGQTLEKMKSFINTEKIDVLLSELEEYFLLRDKKTHSPNYEIFEEIKNAIASLKGRNSIQIKVYFPIREDDYFSITGLETNGLKSLSLVTNWKRIKILSEVFDANVSNANPNLRIGLSLGLVICKSAKQIGGLQKHSKVDISLLENISSLWVNDPLK